MDKKTLANMAVVTLLVGSQASLQGGSTAPSTAPQLPQPSLASQFPSVIHQRLADRFESEELNQKAILEANVSTSIPPIEQGIVLMLRGAEFLKSDQNKLAATDLAAAVKLIPKESQLVPVARMLYLEATLPATKPLAALERIKGLMKEYPSFTEWRPEQYALMMNILISAKSEKLLLKTWGDYESKVRPAQRTDAVSKQVANYLEKHAKIPTKELITVLESMATLYPYSESSRWAFQKLQGLSCAKMAEKNRYAPSLWLLSRLAGNAVLDPGLRSYILESLKGQIRATNGDKKYLEPNEKIAFLMQARLVADAYEAAQAELAEATPSKNPVRNVRRARAMFQLGQIQLRQNDWSAAAATFSNYLGEFSGAYDARSAEEALADSLVRLRLHRSAASIYGRLAMASSSDQVLKWHHFWNTYLVGDYKEALRLLDKPGYVPQRDRGIDGGLDYWRGRILEKLGQKAQADESFRKVLMANGDSFYSILLQASRPVLNEARDQAKPPASHDAAADIRDELEGKDAFAAKLLSTGANTAPEDRLSGDRLDIGVSRLLQKWGNYKLARRLLRTSSWNRVMAGKMFPEIADLAFTLGDFGYGLKAASLPDSPFKQVPAALKNLQEHMAKHNSDWRLMYPMAHEHLVTKYADAANIDPFLVLSIMRAESVYDPDARSAVGAQGLMQIMPFTAIRIARLMGDQEFELTKLHMPEVNIGYASFYLRKLLDYYDGNLLLAVAGYNAGPLAVDRWINAYGNLDMDEFVESVSFKETRRYMKSVLRNLNQYRSIYSEKQALVSLPPLPVKRSEQELF